MTKHIIITGCSSGIGNHLAETIHNNYKEYTVLASVRHQADLERLKYQGIKVNILDLNDEDSIKEFVNWSLEESNNCIYGLINNAAYGQPGAVEDLTRDVLLEQFQCNVFGTQSLTTKVLKNMREHDEGRVIQISSILGLICLPYRGAYNSSKYALEALTDTMRLETADTQIKFTLIEPGPVRSKFRDNSLIKFKQNIDIENSFYKEKYINILKRLETKNEDPFTLGPDSILKPVIHSLTNEKPKIRITVTTPAHIFALLKRYLPYKYIDWLIIKKFKH